jgi:pimeloyl-ACP methyl ester carboxylesterase
MRISGLILSLLISVCVATVTAQSWSDKSAVPQPSPKATQNEQTDIRADQNAPAPLGKLVDVGGYRVHLYCTGTGSPTVVIVGAGFSFDWGLIQPEVAKSTQVCAYDHSGIGWSDSGPKDSCSLRVSEVHNALKSAGIKGPYVLVGHSLGAVVARLYTGRYPDEVAGLVFVDHAFSGLLRIDAKELPPAPPSKTQIFIGGGIEGDPNFSKLSSHDRQLHIWAMSRTRNQVALSANADIMPQCIAGADAITKGNIHPLGDKPLINISTDLGPQVPNFGFPNAKVQTSSPYTKLQAELLSLSLNSKQMIAENSGHFIIIDRPDVVIDAINQVVKSVRNSAPL